MNFPARSSLRPRESETLSEITRLFQERLCILPLILITLLLFFPHVSALTGTDTLIWSPNITLDENSEGYYEFSNFFVLDGDRVVWMNVWSERKSNEPLHTDTIYLLNITTGTTRAIARAPDASHAWTLFPPFSLSRDIVAYTDLGNSDIYLFNITEGKEHRLTHDGALESLDETRGNAGPALDGDRIVWSKKKPYTKGYDGDIVMQNLTTGEFMEICTAKGDQVEPRISGTKVVWRDMRDESGGRGGDIYLYDLATGTEIPVCTAQGLQQQADVYGDTIVWSDFRDGHPAIYLYNLTTKSESRISDPVSNAYQPLIDGNIVAWSEYSSLDRSDNPPRKIVVYDLQTRMRESLNTQEPTYGLEALDGGRIMYSASSGNSSRERGYLHLYVIDMPRDDAGSHAGSDSSATGGQVSNMTTMLSGGASPPGSLASPLSAPGFAIWFTAIAIIMGAAMFRGRKNQGW